MSDWQTIETAPKDGTIILVSSRNGMTLAQWDDEVRGPGVSGHTDTPGWYATSLGESVLDEGWDTGHGFRLRVEPTPTHWMPLPDPPAPSSRSLTDE
jgi:hypothetical protein